MEYTWRFLKNNLFLCFVPNKSTFKTPIDKKNHLNRSIYLNQKLRDTKPYLRAGVRTSSEIFSKLQNVSNKLNINRNI